MRAASCGLSSPARPKAERKMASKDSARSCAQMRLRRGGLGERGGAHSAAEQAMAARRLCEEDRLGELRGEEHRAEPRGPPCAQRIANLPNCTKRVAKRSCVARGTLRGTLRSCGRGGATCGAASCGAAWRGGTLRSTLRGLRGEAARTAEHPAEHHAELSGELWRAAERHAELLGELWSALRSAMRGRKMLRIITVRGAPGRGASDSGERRRGC